MKVPKLEKLTHDVQFLNNILTRNFSYLWQDKNMKKILLLSTIITSSCSVIGINTGETLDYKTRYTNADFEVREYSSYLVAEIKLKKEAKDQSSDAFKRLAGYIFGANTSKNKIAMTTPVIEQQSQDIAMTTPVEQYSENGMYIMRFVMPKKYTIETLPTPKDNRIEIIKVKSKLVAVTSYTWSNSSKKKELNKMKLENWLKDNNQFSKTGSYYFASYNPPWTIPFLKTNEVLVPVTVKSVK